MYVHKYIYIIIYTYIYIESVIASLYLASLFLLTCRFTIQKEDICLKLLLKTKRTSSFKAYMNIFGHPMN